MTESEAFQKYLADAAIEPFNNFGPDAEAYVAGNIQQITDISKEIGIIQ